MDTRTELEYSPSTDVWEGSHAGHQIRVSGSDFAARLDVLAQRNFGLPWDDLGEEEYIDVLAEARFDLAFWSTAQASAVRQLTVVPA